MTLKSKLGIETFPVKEEELWTQLCDAYHEGMEELVLSSGNCTMRIGLERIPPSELDG